VYIIKDPIGLNLVLNEPDLIVGEWVAPLPQHSRHPTLPSYLASFLTSSSSELSSKESSSQLSALRLAHLSASKLSTCCTLDLLLARSLVFSFSFSLARGTFTLVTRSHEVARVGVGILAGAGELLLLLVCDNVIESAICVAVGAPLSLVCLEVVVHHSHLHLRPLTRSLVFLDGLGHVSHEVGAVLLRVRVNL
jgi:hypothetical protein